jgi:Flp pilus assembly protein TadG
MQSRQRGSMLVLGAGILLLLASFAVLALDVGRIYIVRNELQDVADAAALAGANCLTRQSDPASSVGCVSAIASSLNWTRAAAKAQDELSRNTAANAPISSTDAGHQIEVGYWNLLTHGPSGGSFSTTYTPLTANDKPAVRVYVRKDTGVNNGPIAMLTRLMFGSTSDVPMYGEAVAVISAPNTTPPGSLIPMVINQCMFDRFWNSATGQPVIYTGTPADPYGLSVVGRPWELRIGSSYHYDTCSSGQWTTFEQNSNSANEVSNLIATGNPGQLDIGDQTWIKPGTVSSDYQALDAKYPTPPGADVTIVVVNAPGNQLSIQGPLPVVAFAGFHIDDVKWTGGSPSNPGFYVQGHFIPTSVTSGGSGIGPFYGTYTPPRLGY